MKENHRIAEAVHQACLEAAHQAYEQAGISGLCGEGRWEYAIQAVAAIDLEALVRQAISSDKEPA